MSTQVFFTIVIVFVTYFWVTELSTKNPHFPVFFHPYFGVAISLILILLLWVAPMVVGGEQNREIVTNDHTIRGLICQ